MIVLVFEIYVTALSSHLLSDSYENSHTCSLAFLHFTDLGQSDYNMFVQNDVMALASTIIGGYNSFILHTQVLCQDSLDGFMFH